MRSGTSFLKRMPKFWLTSLLLTKTSADTKSNRRKRSTRKKIDNVASTPPTSPSASNRKAFSYPEWRLVAPADGEPTTKEVEGKTYHWCSKDHGRTKGGLWGNHKEEDHKDPRSSSDGAKEKKVSFADAVQGDDKKKKDSNESPESKLSLDRKALLAHTSALKNSSFLAQFVPQGNC